MRRVLVFAGLAALLGLAGAGSRRWAWADRLDVRVAVPEAAYAAVIDPPSFVDVAVPGAGAAGGPTIELRSPLSGQVVKVLGTFGASFTNNGLAISPDARYVYMTLIAPGTVRIERIAVRDRRRTFVADGEQPAVSPNGRLLAYAAGRFDSTQLAVRDLSTGRTRTIDLGPLLGGPGELLDSQIKWLADGRDVAVIPVAIRVTPRTGPTAPAAGRSCRRVPASATCLIIVHLAAGARRLTARELALHGIPAFPIVGGAAAPTSLLLAGHSAQATTIDQVSLSGSGARVTQLLSLPPSELAFAFDPAGTQLLYLVPHSVPPTGPSALWIATLAPGQLLDPHQLIASARFQALGW